MTTKRKKPPTTANGNLKFSFDAGNGAVKGVSNARDGLIKFEPLIAPLTTKKALTEAEARPTFSLKTDSDTLVFGIDDVFKHGKRTAARRLNSTERYLSADYFRLIDVLFLQAFSAYRGNAEYINPVGVISVPISQFNNDDVLGEIKASLVGKRTLEDYEGCTLRLQIDAANLHIIPESVGAMTHYAFEYDSAPPKKRADSAIAGTTLVIDIGYETTDVSVFEGMAYQRDQSFTVPRAGLGIIARDIQEYTRQTLRDADISRIDRAMQAIADTKPNHPKKIEPAPGVFIEVGEVYDAGIEQLANRIADEIRTIYSGEATRVILAGGGAYHLRRALSNILEFSTAAAPNPDDANVLGGMTFLRLKEAAGR